MDGGQPAADRVKLPDEFGEKVEQTGSRYIRTGETGYFKRPVPGWDQDFVVTPEQVIGGGLRFTTYVHRSVLRARRFLDIPAPGIGPARPAGAVRRPDPPAGPHLASGVS